MKEKITHLLYVDDLKTYHKSYNKAALMARTLKDKFQDIGLYWGLDKCATVNVVRGKIVQSTNVNLNYDEQTDEPRKDDRSSESKLRTDRRIPNTNNKQPLYKTEYKDQTLLRALTTTLQYDDVDIAADSLALLQTWKNIPDIVLSVNTSIRQQLLPTATATDGVDNGRMVLVSCHAVMCINSA